MTDTRPNPTESRWSTAVLYPNERTALFIDGGNFHRATSELADNGQVVSYSELIRFFREHTHLLNARYYTAFTQDGNNDALQRLLDHLAHTGFSVRTRPGRPIGNGHKRGDMDIYIAIDALKLAPYLDHVVLASGDGAFLPLLEQLHMEGCKVTVLASVTSRSDDLVREADQVLDPKDHPPLFGWPSTA